MKTATWRKYNGQRYSKISRTRRNQEFYRYIMYHYDEYSNMTLKQCDDIIRGILDLMAIKLVDDGILNIPRLGKFIIKKTDSKITPKPKVDWVTTFKHTKETGERKMINYEPRWGTIYTLKFCKAKSLTNGYFFWYLPNAKLIKKIIKYSLTGRNIITFRNKYE